MVWACQAELIYIRTIFFFLNSFTPANTFLSLWPLVRSLCDLQSAVLPPNPWDLRAFIILHQP